MRALRPLLIAALGLTLAPAVHAQQTLSFFLSAVDATGAPVNGLRPEEIHVTENGKVAPVRQVEPVAIPVKVEVLVDNGLGTASQLVQFRNGLKGFFEALPTGMDASLLTLAPQPRWIVRPTNDRFQLIRGVDRLVPDDGGARVVEGLVEAAARLEKSNVGRDRHYPVIVLLSTTGAETSTSRERDIERMAMQLLEHNATVHIIMLGTGPRGVNNITGARQVGVGKYIADATGGRYEAIAADTRVQTLLPEIGKDVARAYIRQGQQYRVTIERPAGAAGPLGQMAMGVTRSGVTASASLDGRVP